MEIPVTKIYRYEKNGCGVYTASEAFSRDEYGKYSLFMEKLTRQHGWGNISTPGIRRDLDLVGIEFTPDMFCACETIELLNQWFVGFVDEIIELGFSLMEYEVSTYHKTSSGLQCAFLKENVLNKSEINLVVSN